jgi:hypothetical protein
VLNVDGGVNASPAIGSDGTIYIGAREPNELHAIHPNGTLKWAFETAGWVMSSPVIDSDDTIYLSARDLYAINSDGTQKWVFDTGSDFQYSPAIGADGTIYAGNGNIFYAINPDGTEKWKSSVEFFGIQSSPAIGADGTIYATSLNNLYAINGSSGGLADSPWPMFHHNLKHTGNVKIPISPAVTTNPATSVNHSSAILNGTVNPNGSTTAYYFEYGIDSSYGLTTETMNAGSGTNAILVNVNISELHPDAIYHYRIRATNSFVTIYGADRIFKTEKTSALPWIHLLLLGD